LEGFDGKVGRSVDFEREMARGIADSITVGVTLCH
jgi:hypothetical protein